MTPTSTDEREVAVRPRMDPRFAERWVQVRREEGKRRLKFLVAATAILSAGLLAVGSLYTPLLKVRHVRVTVHGSLSARQVRTLAGLAHYKLMVDVDAGAIASRLDDVPQLGEARVRREWPGTVAVTVSVRTPIAIMFLASGEWAAVDATGRVLEEKTGPAPALPIMQGLPDPPAPGQWLDGSLGPDAAPGLPPAAQVDMAAASDSTTVPQGATAALAAIVALPASLRRDVISVTVGAGGSLSMTVISANQTGGSIAVSFGDASLLAQKLEALSTLLTQADLSGVASIDLSVPDRPAALTAR